MCLFLASNIYAVQKCRWFSPLIVILGAILSALCLYSRTLLDCRSYGRVSLCTTCWGVASHAANDDMQAPYSGRFSTSSG